MKNLLLILPLFCLAFVSCSDLDFGDANECNDICENASESGVFSNNGDCVSFCATCSNPSESAATQAICWCEYIEILIETQGGSWEDSGLKNKGQCIKAVKNILNGEDPGIDLGN